MGSYHREHFSWRLKRDLFGEKRIVHKEDNMFFGSKLSQGTPKLFSSFFEVIGRAFPQQWQTQVAKHREIRRLLQQGAYDEGAGADEQL
mmetsp:Transcript_92718/g.193813  ORF Transcript_92718/g.193813 Transcript_92718/m.193813 type:complete len:89 (-) Transcript_92718:1382-1648(-)